MNRNEKLGVSLLVILSIIITSTQTIYWFEPIEESHLIPRPYGEVFQNRGLTGFRIGTITWVTVKNRIGSFNKYYDWKDITEYGNSTDTTKIIQYAIDHLQGQGRLYFEPGYYVIDSLNVTSELVLGSHTILQGSR